MVAVETVVEMVVMTMVAMMMVVAVIVVVVVVLVALVAATVLIQSTYVFAAGSASRRSETLCRRSRSVC